MTAPITQDVLTIPRKLPEGGKPNLVGMTRDQMRAAVENPAPDRTPEAAFQRTRHIAADMLHLAVHPARPTWQSLTNVPKADADFLQEHPTVVGDEGTHRRLTHDALADVDAGLVIDHKDGLA